MPITQSRMIALLSAATDYANALRSLISAINRTDEAYAALPSQQQNWALAYSEILPLAIESNLLKNPIASASTIVVESEHFRRAAKSNIRSAARKRLQRHASGVERRNTAPRSAVFGAPNLEGLEYAEEASRPSRQHAAEVREHSLSTRQPALDQPMTDDQMLEAFKSSLSEDELRKFEETQRALSSQPQPASLAPFLDLAPSAEGEDELDLSELKRSE